MGIDRKAIKAALYAPWPSKWAIFDPQTQKYIKSAEAGSGLKTSWCSDSVDALQLSASDAAFLAGYVGDYEMPMHIIQIPEED